MEKTDKEHITEKNIGTAGYVCETLWNDEGVTAGCLSPTAVGPSSDRNDPRAEYKAIALLPVQTHSVNVKVVVGSDGQPEDTDAIVTFEKGLRIGVLTADCVPILVYAPDLGAVGAIHAGWKGSLGGIVDKTLDLLESYGTDMAGLRVVFGPSISPARYEVDNELGRYFEEAGFADCVSYPEESCGKPHIDLQRVNIERFLRRGVSEKHILPHGGCSYESLRPDGTYAYQSHRRSQGKAGRVLSYIEMYPVGISATSLNSKKI